MKAIIIETCFDCPYFRAYDHDDRLAGYCSNVKEGYRPTIFVNFDGDISEKCPLSDQLQDKVENFIKSYWRKQIEDCPNSPLAHILKILKWV